MAEAMAGAMAEAEARDLAERERPARTFLDLTLTLYLPRFQS